MTDQMYVCCHAPSLALLLFETACSSYTQRGLLLGSVRRQVVTSATDENEANEEEKTVIYVEHCVPITIENIFGPYGELCDGFRQHYEQYWPKIIGWYSFRRNAKQPRCSLQDTLIHKAFLRELKNVDTDAFTLALLTANSQESMSTHSFSQTFLRLNHRNTFDSLRLKIYNLSDKITNSSGYLQNVSFPVSELFGYAIANSRKDESGVSWVKSTLGQVKKQLESLNEQLRVSESQREQLQAEVDGLRARLQEITYVPSAQFVPVLRKKAFIARYVQYKPEIRYGAFRKENPMSVSDEDVDVLSVPPEELEIRSLAAQLKEPESMQTSSPTKANYSQSYLAAVQRSSMGSGDGPSSSGTYSAFKDH